MDAACIQMHFALNAMTYQTGKIGELANGGYKREEGGRKAETIFYFIIR